MRRLIALLLAGALLIAIAVPVTAGGRTVLHTRLTGAAEVPGPGDPDGSGLALIKVGPREGQVCFLLLVKGIATASAAHIHSGAPNVAGPVEVGLTPPNSRGFSIGCVQAEPADFNGLLNNPSGYYVNVHNANFPAGAIRGQLGGQSD